MPHLHLPADHSDHDVVLAATISTGIGSEDLYVTWTYDGGAGAIPEVQALVRDERRPTVRTFLAGLRARVIAAWYGLTDPPLPPQRDAPALAAPPRTGEPSS
jgi:hypothetical protein